jgi:hypothetical protein
MKGGMRLKLVLVHGKSFDLTLHFHQRVYWQRGAWQRDPVPQIYSLCSTMTAWTRTVFSAAATLGCFLCARATRWLICQVSS